MKPLTALHLLLDNSRPAPGTFLDALWHYGEFQPKRYRRLRRALARLQRADAQALTAAREDDRPAALQDLRYALFTISRALLIREAANRDKNDRYRLTNLSKATFTRKVRKLDEDIQRLFAHINSL